MVGYDMDIGDGEGEEGALLTPTDGKETKEDNEDTETVDEEDWDGTE